MILFNLYPTSLWMTVVHDEKSGWISRLEIYGSISCIVLEAEQSSTYTKIPHLCWRCTSKSLIQ